MNTAMTVLAALGGVALATCALGLTNFQTSPRSLTATLRRPVRGIDRVQFVREDDGTFTVTFLSVVRRQVGTVAHVSGVVAGRLAQVYAEATGQSVCL